jgi:hypothetical protein
MSAAQEIYKANVGNTHESAVEAVWNDGFNAGVASVVVAPVTQPVAPTVDATITQPAVTTPK